MLNYCKMTLDFSTLDRVCNQAITNPLVLVSAMEIAVEGKNNAKLLQYFTHYSQLATIAPESPRVHGYLLTNPVLPATKVQNRRNPRIKELGLDVFSPLEKY
jgi:hypothetical protein